MARLGIELRTSDLRVRCPTDCIMRPSSESAEREMRVCGQTGYQTMDLCLTSPVPYRLPYMARPKLFKNPCINVEVMARTNPDGCMNIHRTKIVTAISRSTTSGLDKRSHCDLKVALDGLNAYLSKMSSFIFV